MPSNRAVVSVLLIAVALLAGSARGIAWDRLLSPAIAESALPTSTSAAVSAGWVQSGGCNGRLGVAYTANGGTGSTHPMTLYFTAAGQIQGVGMTISNSPPSSLANYWLQSSSGYTLNVGFRDTTVANICSPSFHDSNPIGNALIVAPGLSAAMSIPLTDTLAFEGGWTNGSCITSMGRHWAWDVTGDMTWQLSNLMPVMPMYMNGALVTFLIQTPNAQIPQPIGEWDGVFPTALFCLNFCNCKYSAFTTFLSTAHFFLTDPALNTCPSGLCG